MLKFTERTSLGGKVVKNLDLVQEVSVGSRRIKVYSSILKGVSKAEGANETSVEKTSNVAVENMKIF